MVSCPVSLNLDRMHRYVDPQVSMGNKITHQRGTSGLVDTLTKGSSTTSNNWEWVILYREGLSCMLQHLWPQLTRSEGHSQPPSCDIQKHL